MFTVPVVASTIAGAIVVWLLQPVITANVKKAIEVWGWDQWLVRLGKQLPAKPLSGLVARFNQFERI
jgi:hypothetical protein